MLKLTKIQLKDRTRIGAWLKGEPFHENSWMARRTQQIQPDFGLGLWIKILGTPQMDHLSACSSANQSSDMNNYPLS